MFNIAIGDIHGRRDLLVAAYEYVRNMYPGSTLILLGDYIDRGGESAQVVEFLIEMQKTDDKLICLMGNHERMMLDACENSNVYGYMSSWLLNGGIETLESYGELAGSDFKANAVDYLLDIPQEHINWMKALPLTYETEKHFFVHAGVNPDRALDNQKEKDLLWIREYFLKTDRGSSQTKHIVHGHTPKECDSDESKHTHRRTNLDSGAVWNNILTAGVFAETKSEPVRFITFEGSHEEVSVRDVIND